MGSLNPRIPPKTSGNTNYGKKFVVFRTYERQRDRMKREISDLKAKVRELDSAVKYLVAVFEPENSGPLGDKSPQLIQEQLDALGELIHGKK